MHISFVIILMLNKVLLLLYLITEQHSNIVFLETHRILCNLRIISS